MDMKLVLIRELLDRASCTSDDLNTFRMRLAIMDRDITLDDLDSIFESLRDLEGLVYKAIINLRKEETQNEKP